MESFVGRSQDVFMVTETRRERRIFIVTCAICILIAIGIFVLGVNLFLNKKYKTGFTAGYIKCRCYCCPKADSGTENFK